MKNSINLRGQIFMKEINIMKHVKPVFVATKIIRRSYIPKVIDSKVRTNL